MRDIKLLAISFLMLFSVSSAFSQKTATWQNPQELYNSAYELFQKQKYGAAQKQFLEVVEIIDAPSSLMEANAEYYAALCALELFNDDAEEMLTAFIEAYPEHSKVRTAHFQLGKYQYRKKRYRQAIRSFEVVDVFELNSEQKDEYYFKLGYAYFMSNDYEQAKNNFYKIIEKDNKYHDPANYYYGHIAYENKNFETALNSFNKLLDNKIFKPVLPYYITQIYYMQEKYDKLLEVAPGLLESATRKRTPEIARLIGDAYYKTEKYKESIPYLEQYYNSTQRSTTRDDHYQLAYAYYHTNMFAKAVPHFDKVTTKEDTMSQNAHYHMAACYLETGEKKFAYNSFLAAYKNKSIPETSKDALFNYAKLAYEMGYDPYNEAIKAFQKFIQEYPESERVDEANSYLVKLFLSTKNYKLAIEAMDKIVNKSTKLKVAYQQIAYYRGVELFNAGQLEAAAKLFEKSMKFNYNKELYAKSVYWTAEAQYRRNDFNKAIHSYKRFQLTAGAFRLPYYNESNYHIGYAYFKEKEYKNALYSFRKYLDNVKSLDNKMVNDAMLRTGDCFYMEKRYTEAVDVYQKAADLQVRDVDYALYQKAIAQGVMGQFKDKTQTLKTLVEDMPKSAYADNASFELANTYLIVDDNQNALLYFNHLINNYPNSGMLVEAMQKKALVYYNTDNYDLALNTFKNIRKKYPGTKQSKEALVSIRNIYTNIGQAEAFFKYAKENAITLTDNDQDSLMFVSAQKTYMEGDCEKANTSLRKYLNKFPKGLYALEAHYYIADCLYRNGNKSEAASHYQLIADTSRTDYTEESVMHLAEIKYNSNKYNAALHYYKKLESISAFKKNILEARKWIMRSHYKLYNYPEAMASARKLMKTDKVSDQWKNEAYMTIGRSALKLDSMETAKSAFKYLSENLQNELAVEAKYLIAEIEYNKDNLKESESILFEIINQVPSYDYWIAKSFILIADIYYQRDNVVQAKATLESIIENYKPDTSGNRQNLVTEAQDKLDNILKKEEEKNKPQQPEDMELDYSGDEESELFNTEETPDTLNNSNDPQNPMND